MKMNRRNVLIGLGGIVASGGALLGTGAFSTVEADRSVTVETAGDATALIQFNPTSDYASLNNGKLEISLTGANIDGTVEATGIFEIINTHSTDDITLDSEWTGSGNNIDVTLTPQNTTVAADGGSTLVDLHVDTTDAAADATLETTITITANTV